MFQTIYEFSVTFFKMIFLMQTTTTTTTTTKIKEYYIVIHLFLISLIVGASRSVMVSKRD